MTDSNHQRVPLTSGRQGIAGFPTAVHRRARDIKLHLCQRDQFGVTRILPAGFAGRRKEMGAQVLEVRLGCELDLEQLLPRAYLQLLTFRQESSIIPVGNYGETILSDGKRLKVDDIFRLFAKV